MRFAVLAAGLVVGITAVLAPPAAAQPMVTDRPDFSESASIVPVGRVQIETGVLRVQEPSFRTDQVLGSLVRVGIDTPLEFRLSWAGYNRLSADNGPDIDGQGDLSLGLKVALPPCLGADAALIGTVTVPSGGRAFRSQALDPEVRIALARGIGYRWSVGANLGGLMPARAGGGRDRTGLYSLVLARTLTPEVALGVEAYGFVGDGEAHYLDAVLAIAIRENLQLDLLAGYGLGGDAADWFGGGGISFRFPR